MKEMAELSGTVLCKTLEEGADISSTVFYKNLEEDVNGMTEFHVGP